MGKQPVAKGQKKTKEAIARAAAASRKGQKKKWGGQKTKEKLNRDVYLTKETLANMEKGMPKMNVITINNLMDRYKIIGGIAKKVIEKMLSEEKIKPFETQNHKFNIYKGVNAALVEEETKNPKKGGAKKQTKK